MERSKAFVSFLKANGIYGTALEYLAVSGDYGSIDSLCSGEEPEDYLLAMFDFSFTVEGSDYWNMMNDRWLEVYGRVKDE